MLNSVYLENFQGFGQGSSVRLAPFTLIFGPNSAGKSSIGRALRLMQQSFEPNPAMNSNRFTTAGASINLASYKNLVFNHDVGNVVTLGAEVRGLGLNEFSCARFTFDADGLTELVVSGMFECDDGPEEMRIVFEKVYTKDTALEDASEWVVSDQSRETMLKLVELYKHALAADLQGQDPGDFLIPSLFRASRLLKRMHDNNAEALAKRVESAFTSAEILETIFHVSVRGFTPSYGWQEGPLAPRKMGEEQVEKSLNLIERNILASIQDNWIHVLGQVQRTLIGGLKHIGGVREIPDRIQLVSSDSNSYSLIAKNLEYRTLISDWMEGLTDGSYKLRYQELKSDANDAGILGEVGFMVLEDLSTGANVSFQDVGVGLSQVLPILSWLAGVSSNVAQEGTQHNLKSQSNILLIEQPELHLHPRMQGKLLDLLLDVGKVSDGSIQIIAETHSEAFLLKLQSAIRSGRVDPKDVALVYVERVEGLGSKATELELTPDGDIAGKWPDLTNFAAVRFEQTK